MSSPVDLVRTESLASQSVSKIQSLATVEDGMAASSHAQSVIDCVLEIFQPVGESAIIWSRRGTSWSWKIIKNDEKYFDKRYIRAQHLTLLWHACAQHQEPMREVGLSGQQITIEVEELPGKVAR